MELSGGQAAGLALVALLEALIIAGLLVERRGRRREGLSLAGRLRFETLLSELSARLIPVSLRDVDSEIKAGLGRVVAFLGMDRASLDEQVGAGEVVRIGVDVARAETPMPTIEPGRFPWTAGRLQQGQVVRFARRDELPEQAAVDRQSYRDLGIRSYVALPLGDGGTMLGVLSFDSIRAERAWSDELTKRLQVLGEVFAGALGRKRLEFSLAERLRFETLLSEQTATFSSLPLSEVDREIERALRRIADFFQADWGSLTEFSQGSPVARITHSWAAEGVAPPQTVSLAEIPWIMGRWDRGEMVRFSRIEELPEGEAGVDRVTLARLGVTSQVGVPLKVGGAVLGALTFSTLTTARVWPDELVQRLLLLGEVFANMLSRRRAELEAQRLRQDLSHVGRVSTMGALTTSLAHELNQPLTAILSNAQAAQRILGADPPNLETVREILTAIVSDDRRAAEVIGRLRGLLKRGKLERSAVDVNEVVSEVARLVRGDAELRDVLVRLDLDPGLPPVKADRVQLQQVALNLILNALDAMRESARPRTLVLRTHREGGAVRVAVCDSGTGIEPADQEHIFDAFYTTKADGLGMGLAIARSIVDEHGGCLDARNNPDGGATFSFTVPAWTEAP